MQAGGRGKRRRGGSPKKRRAEAAKLPRFVEGKEPLRVEGESADSAVCRYETSLLGLSLEFVPETLVGDGRRQGERKLPHGMRQGDVALLRGAPYLRSPLIGQPRAESWQRI